MKRVKQIWYNLWEFDGLVMINHCHHASRIDAYNRKREYEKWNKTNSRFVVLPTENPFRRK